VGGVSGIDLAKYVGATVARVSRLRYQVGDDVEAANDGSIEITFGSGAVLLCEAGADGETVRIEDKPWVDPFAGPLSPENEEYVATSGKWTKFDVSEESPFTDLVGRKVSDVAPVDGGTGKRYGLVVNVSGYLLAVYTMADELRVRLLS
jgi:hypothetical protein